MSTIAVLAGSSSSLSVMATPGFRVCEVEHNGATVQVCLTSTQAAIVGA
jgi:hypothetical protein